MHSNTRHQPVARTSRIEGVMKFGTPVTNSPWSCERGALNRAAARASADRSSVVEAADAIASASLYSVALLSTLWDLEA
jgi:hypothetical protein